MNLGSASVFLVAVSFIAPTASTSYVEPHVANLAYVEPVAKTSYIEAKVKAEITFPDVYSVEIITPTDLVALTVTKGNQETLTTSDTFFEAFTKNLVESPVLSDSFSSISSFIRSYTDTAISSDSTVLLSQLAKDETLVSSDVSILTSGKGLTEGITLTDNMDGVLQYDIVKTTSESLTGTDSYSVAFSPSVNDNTTLSSSGFVIMQNYSDITYFLEDYVGSSTSFT